MSGRGPSRLAPLASLVVVLSTGLAACGDEAAQEPADDAATISVTRAGDSFTPSGERVDLAVGQTLTLSITADEAGELHVHSTPEQEIAYGEGTSEHEITIERPGVVEVENHDPATVVLQLEVR